MATLKHVETGVEFELAARHLVGRASTCQLQLAEARVSGVHAELSWDGSAWRIQDLGSSNGTLVDDRKLTPGEAVALRSDQQLVFGAQSQRYRVLDLHAPRLLAIAPGGATRVATDGILSLPCEDEPEATIYADAFGGWKVESEDGVRALAEVDSVAVAGVVWTVHLPQTTAPTVEGRLDADSVRPELALYLRVSRDEEHIAIEVEHEGQRVGLASRAHAALLLLLARSRLSDAAQPDLPPSEHGWVYRDDLLDMLKIDIKLLNLWTYRARNQFAKAGLPGAGGLIERRIGPQQLRIAFGHLHVSSA